MDRVELLQYWSQTNLSRRCKFFLSCVDCKGRKIYFFFLKPSASSSSCIKHAALYKFIVDLYAHGSAFMTEWKQWFVLLLSQMSLCWDHERKSFCVTFLEGWNQKRYGTEKHQRGICIMNNSCIAWSGCKNCPPLIYLSASEIWKNCKAVGNAFTKKWHHRLPPKVCMQNVHNFYQNK